MLRTGKTWHYQREALPVAEGKAICTARLRPVQDVSNSSKTDGLFFATTSFSATKNRRTCRPVEV